MGKTSNNTTIDFMQIMCNHYPNKMCGELKGTLDECKTCQWNIKTTYASTIDQGWQVCPRCNGKGFLDDCLYYYTSSAICDVCNGKKIINIQTGKPPD